MVLMSIGIMTGDIVHSGDLEPHQVDAIIELILNLKGDLMRWDDDIVYSTRTRGDGWQIGIQSPRRALRAALLVKATLQAAADDLVQVETRIAIGVGDGEMNADLNSSHGTAFVASGTALETMGRNTRIVHASGGAIGAATRLADSISQDWTVAQARAIEHLIHPDSPTRAVVGDMLGISRQAVDKSAHAANWPALSQALEMIETSS